nr:Calx-beta domain-containing protein [uncultured Flavobacterium sp.]
MIKKFTQLLIMIGCFATYAQEMPVVFNKNLSEGNSTVNKVVPLESGDLIIAGGGSSKAYITKLSEDGKVLFERTIVNRGIDSYRDIVVTKRGSFLAVGGGTLNVGAGRISLFDSKGTPVFDKVFGENDGGYFTTVKEDLEGNFIAVGVSGGILQQGRIVKFTLEGKIIFDKFFDNSTVLHGLIIDENNNILSMGSSVDNSNGSGVLLKLDTSGVEIFHQISPIAGGVYKEFKLLEDESLLAIGGGGYGSGNSPRITRIRMDGQVIFDKTYSNVDGIFTALEVDPSGYIYASAEEFDRGRMLGLRFDGTMVFNQETDTPLTSIKRGEDTNIVAIGGKEGQGVVIKTKQNGKLIFEKKIAHALKELYVSEDNDIYATTAKDFSIVKFDTKGNLVFDKNYVKGSKEGHYASLIILPTGEMIALGTGTNIGGRITKISQGATINDISVSEPLNGIMTASVRVILSGFLRKDGVRMPVKISYKCLSDGTASGEDYLPSEGVLSFLPSDFATGSLIEKTIEIPIKSDSNFEDSEYFNVKLSSPEYTYIAKEEAKITIINQAAVVRFVGGSDAEEKGSLSYELGLFSQDGKPLVNKTSKALQLNYMFGNGSATEGQDFFGDTKTALKIPVDQSSAKLLVKTKDDNLFEDIESVQLVLTGVESNSVESMVEFLGGARTISHIQKIKDQAAELQISKLSNRNESSVLPVAMFKVFFTKVSDGKQLVNCSGSDIRVKFDVDATNTTAVLNKDFVILNSHDLVIAGNCDNMEADIQVLVIPDVEQKGDKNIALKLKGVDSLSTAGIINISQKQDKAMATVLFNK